MIMLVKAWSVACKRCFSASLLACIVSMLACATVSAECAWVLWNHVTPLSVSKNSTEKAYYKDTWELLAAFITYDQCREAQQRVWKSRVEDSEPCRNPSGCANRKIQKVPYTYLSILWDNPSKDMLLSGIGYKWECIPDTIDPRK